MELFETLMTGFAVVACGVAWYRYQRKTGAGVKDSLKSTKEAIRN